jgi:nucleoside-diphosphate-sugar epimerase
VTQRWAITGGSGFLGLHLARRLVAEGRAVRSLDLEPQPLAEVEARIGDVRDRDAADWLVDDADVLVHAAAALPIRGSARTLRSINVDGTRAVLEAAVAAGVRRAILVSSAVVYGLQPSPTGEDAAPAPMEAYGRSKLEAERLWREAPLDTVILRPTAFVGPGRLGVFGLLFDWIREGRRIYTLGHGTNRYQLLAVEDLVEALSLAAERPVAGGLFNLGATRFGTVADELGALIRRAVSGSRVTPLPAGPARVVLAGLSLARLSPLAPWHYRSADRDFSVDVSRAERTLGWMPQHSNGEALWRSYEWYIEHRAELGSEHRPTHRAPWREKALGLARRLS